MWFWLKDKSVFYVTGYNQYNIDLKIKSLHAEVDAINKLKYSEKKKKIILVVFRINKKGDKYLMSKPCCHCMKYIESQLEKKNYKLYRGFYSDNNGNFIRFKI